MERAAWWRLITRPAPWQAEKNAPPPVTPAKTNRRHVAGGVLAQWMMWPMG